MCGLSTLLVQLELGARRLNVYCCYDDYHKSGEKTSIHRILIKKTKKGTNYNLYIARSEISLNSRNNKIISPNQKSQITAK